MYHNPNRSILCFLVAAAAAAGAPDLVQEGQGMLGDNEPLFFRFLCVCFPGAKKLGRAPGEGS